MHLATAVWAAVLAVALALGGPSAARLAAESAEAGGLTYEGTQEAGGLVRVTLADDGSRITAFEIEGVAGGGCSWDTITLANWGAEIPLTDGRFAVVNPDGDQLEGGFAGAPDPRDRLEGTITVRDPVKACETPPLRWVAGPAVP